MFIKDFNKKTIRKCIDLAHSSIVQMWHMIPAYFYLCMSDQNSKFLLLGQQKEWQKQVPQSHKLFHHYMKNQCYVFTNNSNKK